jgi:hypothetical protein
MDDENSARAREKICACGTNGDAPDAGAESVIVRDQRGKLQAERRVGHRWSAKAEAVFLAELEATCNVMASAAAAGFSTTAVYRRRQSHAAFRAAWEAALETGYARLEMALVCAATNLLEPVADGGADDASGAVPFGGMTVREALQVLRLHRYGARGGAPQRFDWRAKPADPDATRAEILRKLDIVEQHDAKACGGKARARR